MRIKCANNCENLTVDRLYHVMDEDDNNYYVVNDSCVIAKYTKDKFYIANSRVKIVKNAHYYLPNENEVWFVKGSVFSLQGRYKHNGKYMNVITMRENELPIAIPDGICEII